ncbi:MAG: glycosyltransferase [Geminicoccaceae bacterium]
MSISAVILSFNACGDLERCIRSLIDVERFEPGRDQILIVDNGSTDGSKGLIKTLVAEFPALIEGIDLPANLGTTVSRNLALAKAKCDHLLIIDSDIFFERPVLRKLLVVLESDPKIGIVAPRLTFPDGRPQMSTDMFPTLPRKLERLFRLRALERQADPRDGRGGAVDYAISAFWLMRRALLRHVGLLDQRIFYAPEDVDYGIRTWLAGYRIVFSPELAVIHNAKERSRSWKGLLFTWRHIVGLAYLFRKHGYLWRAARLYRAIDNLHDANAITRETGRPAPAGGKEWAGG